MVKKFKVRLEGVRPLLMSNGRLTDPMDPFSVEIAKFDKLHHSKKTVEGAKATDLLRWLGQTYANEEGKLILPRENMLGCLVKAARVHKLGTKAASGLWVVDDSILKFESNDETIEELKTNPKYTLRVRCKRGVMLTRPMIPDWSAEFEIHVDTRVIGTDEAMTVFETAGAIGIGAWSARFGKFDLGVEEIVS